MTIRSEQGADMGLKLISFPTREGTRLENNLARSVSALLEALCEPAEVERATGRAGLSQRVCLAVSDVTLDAMRLARSRVTDGGTGRRVTQDYIGRAPEESPRKAAQHARRERE